MQGIDRTAAPACSPHHNHVTHSKILCPHFSSEMGRKHGGRFTPVDGTLFVRFCAVGLGVGRYPLESYGADALVHDVSAVWQALLAHGFA
jgi:hypothetical protein